MSTFQRALILSLLAHGALLLLLARYEKAAVDESARAPLEVKLVTAPARTSAASTPELSPLPPPPPPPREPAPSPTTTPAPVAAETPGSPVDWRAEAQDVINGMNESRHEYRAPNYRGERRPTAATPERIPGMTAGFRPMRRQLKVCGHLVEFTFGIHDISMPVAYLCEDKAVEYEMAPGAGRNIGTQHPD